VRTTIRNYEALYIVDPALSDEQIESIIARHSTVIADQGGEVKAAGKWEKRRLAYEILGRREGIYILMFFDGEPAVAKELDRVFRIADDVIRHIITRVEPEHVDTTRIERPQPTAAAAETVVPVEVGAAVETVEPAEEVAAVQEAAGPAEEAAEEPAVEEPAVLEATEPAEEIAPEPAEAEEQPQAEESTEETEGQEQKAQE